MYTDTEKTINSFGFCEMYEWANIPEKKFGRFVQFSNESDKKHCITHATDINKIFGVSSVNSYVISDNPSEWFLKYLFNAYGDLYYTPKTIANAEKVYDDVLELSYIKTFQEQIYMPIINESFNETEYYVERSKRKEWVRVNLIGKCVVEDNGTCEAGDYCTLYDGTDENLYGTAIKADDNHYYINKWYVLNRVSDTTILILFK